ncbi:MAG: hypothetical protein QM723_31315 [Myxococcaceae bacterium]
MSRTLLLLLFLAGCSRDHVMATEGELHLAPATIDFGQTWVGAPATAHATVTFASTAACDVTLQMSAPFTVSTTTLHLQGGAPVDLTLGFTATAPGASSSTLTVTGCGKHASAPVTANAATPPQCPAPAACATFVFSPDAGFCVSTAVPDGTACSEACLVDAACHGGECTGTALNCDDGDSCTLDTCSVSTGCQHLPADAICPPLPGCAVNCDGGDCGTLREVWSVAAEPGWLIQPTVADDSGNLYWLERGGEAEGSLVSYDRNGALRYRVPVNLVNTDPRPMIAGDAFVFTGDLGDQVSAYRTRDGALLWTVHLRDALLAKGYGQVAGQFSYTDHGTIGATGELVFPIGFTDLDEHYFVALDPQTGATRWIAWLGWHFWDIQSDEQGQLYVQIAYGNGTEVAAFHPNGMTAWTSSEFVGPTLGGKVFGRGAVLGSTTGAVDYSFSSNMAYPPDVVLPHLGARRDYQLGGLQTFDPSDGTVLGQWLAPTVMSWQMFASADDELMALDGPSASLIAVGPDAQPTFTCHVPAVASQLQAAGDPTLIPGLLLLWTTVASEDLPAVSTLHAYALPGRTGATAGWSADHGSMSRANKPR